MRGFFALLLILFVVVIGVGLYFHWFSFALNRNAEGQTTGMSFNFNRGRVANTTERAGQAVKNLGKKIGHAGTITHTVTGTLTNVDGEHRQITVNTAKNRPVTVQVQPDTQIRRNDVKANINDLVDGDHLQVIYRDENDKHVAQSVTVESGT